MKSYYLAPIATIQANAQRFGVHHWFSLDGVNAHQVVVNFPSEHDRQAWEQLADVTVLPGLLDPTPIGAAVAGKVHARIGALATDTMHGLALRFTKWNSQFRPE